MWYRIVESKLGRLAIAGANGEISAARIGDDDKALEAEILYMFPEAVMDLETPSVTAIADSVVDLIDNPHASHNIPLSLKGTAFQKKVWDALCAIPTGRTVTYTTIAREIGEEKAVRAVANACGANPVAVMVPCHRVLRSDGGIGGYRWGVERKRQLLANEAVAQ
ncbi:methylated-DNA--[protein]-cysteine S-methyltransferase [Leisingera sp. M523]|uniref:methylated-DNA--[protein]-cysteine S-methyltransferase n=1 Tax=Leisingera sp. M523 TaxID=2867013 RepID=UPI0021A2855E|nr:methylated-DNA--[protein]-cysteine S-methyltransferase [Leisingera sp. M523]UWQ29248.1 methylated-DNA--[protein]-cysteine S-methyltransferase [Leisingera sp. M523]